MVMCRIKGLSFISKDNGMDLSQSVFGRIRETHGPRYEAESIPWSKEESGLTGRCFTTVRPNHERTE
jgi:hypothetical protein